MDFCHLGLVVQKIDNVIHWINYYPVIAQFVVFNTYMYPLDSDLFGYHYPPFQQPGINIILSLSRSFANNIYIVVGCFVGALCHGNICSWS